MLFLVNFQSHNVKLVVALSTGRSSSGLVSWWPTINLVRTTLVLILHSHPLGVGLLLPCVASPVLSIAAAKLRSPVSVHTRLPVLAATWRCWPRLAQCSLVVGNLSMTASDIVTIIHPHICDNCYKKISLNLNDLCSSHGPLPLFLNIKQEEPWDQFCSPRPPKMWLSETRPDWCL